MNCTGILILLGIINLVFAIILLRRFGILGYKKAREAVIGSVVEDTLAVVENPAARDAMPTEALETARQMAAIYAYSTNDPQKKSYLKQRSDSLGSTINARRERQRTGYLNSLTSLAGAPNSTPSRRIRGSRPS